MRKVLPWALAGLLLAAPAITRSQSSGSGDQVATKNADQARAALNAMVQALGGQAWLNIKNVERDGHFAVFFHGNPDLGTTRYYLFHQWPDHDRIEYTKHRDVVQFYIGDQGWEVTYKGKHPLPKDQVQEHIRARNHSIEMAVKVWMKNPKTILIYEGPRLVERHLGIEVSLISPTNEAITIIMSSDTHLPLRVEFKYRDPVYHDLDTEAVEYNNYHIVDGFPTAFRITRIKNGETTQQRYIDSVKYNQTLPPDFWDPNAASRRIKR